MQLSDKALTELNEILSRETGGVISDFDREELNKIGELLLNVLAENLKLNR